MPGQNILTDSLTNADVSQPNWIYGTSQSGALPPILTARSTSSASSGGLPGVPAGGTVDTAGSGALRLTNNANGQGSFAIYNKPINSSAGLSVQFKLYSYGGTGADGISFFLIDGSQNPTVGGAVGGSLGYSSSTVNGTVPGIVGGYLGIGFDEFGNFSVNQYGANGNATSSPQSIAVRGREGLNYPLLTSTGTLPNGVRIDSSATTRSGAGRLVDVELDNTGKLSVSFDLNGDNTIAADGTETVIKNYDTVPTNGAAPSTFKFGFAASTGGSTNFHEVNNLAISTFSGAYTPLVSFPPVNATLTPNKTLNVTATIDAVSAQPVIIPLNLSGTATQGTDYSLSAPSITIAPGQTTGSVTLTDSSTPNTNKTIQISLGTPTNATISPQASTFNVTLSPSPFRSLSVRNDGCDFPDFNGDGKVDLLWSNSPTNQNAIWLLDGVNVTNQQFLQDTGPNWQIVTTRDFNGDGKSDLLWRNTTTGENAIWLMNGTTPISQQYITTTPAAWSIADVADFNGDGKADLVWRNTTTGENAIWLMNGTTPISQQYILTVADQNWQIVAAEDTNADGKADLIWRNAVTGENGVWLINGATVTQAAYIFTTAPSWTIADVCDTNGDGKADLIWRNTVTGEDAVWLMNGATVATPSYITQVSDLNWKIIGARDTNGDGKADLIWRNTTATGEDAIWLMDGVTPTNQQYISKVSDLNWRINIRPDAIVA